MSGLGAPFRYRNDHITLALIALNVAVYIFQMLFPAITKYLAMAPILVLHGWVWQFGTYMFAHGGVSHLLFNMLGLFIFGTQVERHIGSAEFLLYYLLTGVLAGAFSFGVYLLTGAYGVFLLGASGAIFAVQLAYAAFFPDSVMYVWGILPLRAPVMVLGFTGVEIISSVFGLSNGVAHLTHLAGFGFGWLYFLIRFGKNPWRSMMGR